MPGDTSDTRMGGSRNRGRRVSANKQIKMPANPKNKKDSTSEKVEQEKKTAETHVAAIPEKGVGLSRRMWKWVKVATRLRKVWRRR